MYIVTCAMDRKIRIFDFFSGDIISEVYGHSDAITGVKFSPDGRHIISIGGDGCILVWKVPPTLIAAMQDRLLELYSAAQKRLNIAQEATPLNDESKVRRKDIQLVNNDTASKNEAFPEVSSEQIPAPAPDEKRAEFLPPDPPVSKG